MHFYLGAHMAHWLGRVDVPLFVADRQLRDVKTLPVAQTNWALDSGGFTELSMYGEWRTTPDEYVRRMQQYVDEIGLLDFAAPQDWMCEPNIRDKTGLTVEQHQRLTLDNYLTLRSLDATLPIIPVLQGYEIADYLRHRDAYERAGIDLEAEPRVGIGSVCRRQNTSEIADLFYRLRQEDLRMHAFGVKTQGLARYGGLVASADSLSWSLNARFIAPLEGHEEEHASCSNCVDYALAWRERTLESASRFQPQLGVDEIGPADELITYPPGDPRISGAPTSRMDGRSHIAPQAVRSRSRHQTEVILEAVQPLSYRPPSTYVALVDQRVVGEVDRTTSGTFRAVPLGARLASSRTFATPEQAAASVWWNVIETRFAEGWAGDTSIRCAVVRFRNGQTRHTLCNPYERVVSPRLYSTPEDALHGYLALGMGIFEANATQPEVGGEMVDVFVDYMGGLTLRTRANNANIVGLRYVGMIELDLPAPDFADEAWAANEAAQPFDFAL